MADGPWLHRDVVANGFSFHVALGEHHDALRGTSASASGGRLPLVVLLHGFAQFWYAWRHQLPALDLAGHPAAALDLRGCGASDQPPRGYDRATFVRDLVGVVRGLGHQRAVIVGHDLGAAVGWASAAYAPEIVAGLVSVAAPSPGGRTWGPTVGRLPAWSWSWRDGRRVERYLRGLTGRPDALRPDAPGPDALSGYRRALSAWPGPQRAVAPLRHHDRAVRRTLLRRPADVDLLTIRGAVDPVVSRPAAERAARFVSGRHDHVELPGVGHLPPEEDPHAVTAALLDWLPRPTGVPRTPSAI